MTDVIRTVEPMIFVSASGAGTSLAAELCHELWATPGASRYFAGFAFPYAREQMRGFLAEDVEQSVSTETAIKMAIASYLRARASRSLGEGPVGLGITAAVATDRERKGDARVHVAAIGPAGTFIGYERFEPGVGEEARMAHEQRVREFARLAVLHARGLAAASPQFEDGEATAIEILLRQPVVDVNPHDGALLRVGGFPGRDVVRFPGAFNPPHAGHRRIVEQLGQPVIAELEIQSPHKPPLALRDVLDRIVWVKRVLGTPTFVTNGLPAYIDKARAWHGCRFLLSAESLQRALTWQGAEPEYVLADLTRYAELIYVAGRVDSTGHFLDLASLNIPPWYRHKFAHVSGRLDLSSSELRGQAARSVAGTEANEALCVDNTERRL